jgi:hypothetical protein
MILLILGLLIICVLFYQIYIIKRNEEPFVGTVSEVQIQNQRDFLNEQDKYYDVRRHRPGAGLLVSKPGINTWYKLDKNKNLKQFTQKVGLDQSDIDKKVTNCRALTKCEQLANNDCGYCSATKEFDFGNNRGPKTDVCPDKMWTSDVSKCKELREKTICSNIKNCGDLYGEAEKLCGYCPTSGNAMVMEKIGNKYFPKYKDDVCAGAEFGLIPGSKCKQFAKDHPCVTPYHLSGPHSGACIKKLWKNSACTNARPYGKTFENLGKAINMSYKEAGSVMKETNNKTRSINYYDAVSNSDLCYGNHNNINPCDMKYNQQGIPHPVCLQQMFLEAGGTQKGTGWSMISETRGGWEKAKKHIKKVNELSQSSWSFPAAIFGTTISKEEYKKKITKIMENIQMSDKYQKRYNCSMFMLGIKSSPPEPIKAGDDVVYVKEVTEGRLRFEGIVTRKIGNQCEVMFLKSSPVNGGVVRDRSKMSIEDQKKYFGWPKIIPTYNTQIPETIHIRKLNLKKSCSNNKSQCKMTCKDKINDVFYKYPRPRDCIVGPWGEWSKCSKKCGGGVKIRKRSVKYPAKFGGQQCPVLENKGVCNTQVCTNPNFSEQYNSGLYENNKLQFVGWTPNQAHGKRGLKECQADCDADTDCAPGLKCFQRSGNEKVPGCEGNAVKDADYCILKEKFIKNIPSHKKRGKLGQCEGDCNSNNDCQTGLICKQRSGNSKVVGCAGNPIKNWDYCVPRV